MTRTKKRAPKKPFDQITVVRVEEVRREDRTSPCAGQCRHAWCAGYHAGYWEGFDDGRVDDVSPR